MPAFNPPNPYGSYFNFSSPYAGDPSPEQWRNPNYPNLGTPMSTGVAAAMGQASGGINPTQQEFLESRRRDIAYQQFVDRAVKEDARTRTIGNMVMQGIYGNDMRSRMSAMTKIGGADAYNGIIGTLINTPGVSGYLGGSQRSLAVGSLAAATSGLTMNGYGVFGDKGMNVRFADNLLQNVNRQFYGANGNPILSMTNGLNRDQIGGIMTQAASQGAFTGLDMGSFQKLDSAGRRAKFIANDGTTQKITDFLKDTTKALSSLIDVYGNISSGELMQKAQEITGLDLSRLGNAKIMGDRIQKLRDTARLVGVDNASMFDLAARGGDYARSIGAASGLAGTLGTWGAMEGAKNFRMRQLNTHGFYAPSETLAESVFSANRDIVGMSNDPMGSRMVALEMLIRNNGLSSGDAASVRAQASSMAASGAGVAGIEGLAQSRFGVSLSGTLRSMGGAQNIWNSMDPESAANAVGMMNTNMAGRRPALLKAMMGRSGWFKSAADLDAMHTIATTFDNDSIEKMMGGADMGDYLGVVTSVGAGGDAQRASLRQAMQRVRGMGAGAYHNTRDLIQSNPLLRDMASLEARKRNAFMSVGSAISDDFRGNMLGGGFVAGMFDKFTGSDPMSQLQWMAAVRPELVAGVKENIDFDTGHYLMQGGGVDLKAWAANMLNFKAGLSKTSTGLAMLKPLGLDLLGPQYNPNAPQIGADGKPTMQGIVSNKLLALYDRFRDDPQGLMAPFQTYMAKNGRGTFITKQDADAQARYGHNAVLLSQLADAEEKAGASSTVIGNIRQQAQALLNGGIFRSDRNGKLYGKAIGSVSRGQADKINSDANVAHLFMGAMMDPHFKLEGANAELLASFRGSSAGAELGRELKDKMDNLNMVVGHKFDYEKEKIRKVQEALGDNGPTAKRDDAAPQTMQLSGDVRILPDGIGGAIIKFAQGAQATTK